MTELDYVKAAVLGAIQGVTEFLPISSSGHLALVQRWMGLDPDSPGMLLFDVLAHLGTLVAVGIVFLRPGKAYLVRLMRESVPTWTGRRHAWRIALLTVAATIPTAAIGVGFKESLEAAFDKPVWIGTCLGLTGGCLGLLGRLSRGRRGWKDFRWWHAALVGVAQGTAILPGISRSGLTICVACYCGLRRRWAAQFSFLIAFPAIAGATLLKLNEVFDRTIDPAAAVAWGPVLCGTVLSLVVGVLALRLLLGAVRRARLHYFAPYCLALAAVVLLSAW